VYAISLQCTIRTKGYVKIYKTSAIEPCMKKVHEISHSLWVYVCSLVFSRYAPLLVKLIIRTSLVPLHGSFGSRYMRTNILVDYLLDKYVAHLLPIEWQFPLDDQYCCEDGCYQ
jgi:hypothetical protein